MRHLVDSMVEWSIDVPVLFFSHGDAGLGTGLARLDPCFLEKLTA